MARMVVIGASQGIGLETVKAALAAGHTVRAFARSAAAIAITDPNLEKHVGDALDPGAIKAAIKGQDVVIQSLGVALNPQTVLNGTTLFSTATRIVVDAMVASGPNKLICVTGFGAGNSRDQLGLLFRSAFQLSLARIYADKDVQEMMIQRSPLEWLIVRPGFLTSHTSKPAQAVLDPKQWRMGPVARKDVASFIIANWNNPVYLRTTPALVA
jgi:uncharacterized protein YbjT (DUF2867 family)